MIFPYFRHLFPMFGAFAIFDSQWLSKKRHHFRAGFQDLWVPRSVGGNMPYTIPFLRYVAYSNPKCNVKAIKLMENPNNLELGSFAKNWGFSKSAVDWWVLTPPENNCWGAKQVLPIKKDHKMSWIQGCLIVKNAHFNSFSFCWAHRGWGRGAQSNRIC